MVVRNAKIDEGTRFMLSCEMGHYSVVKKMIKEGKVDINKALFGGTTPLAIASQHGQSEIVGILLKTGLVDADKPDEKGVTPLMWASTIGHDAIVKMLLEEGKADPNKKSPDEGATALIFACLKKIIKLYKH